LRAARQRPNGGATPARHVLDEAEALAWFNGRGRKGGARIRSVGVPPTSFRPNSSQDTAHRGAALGSAPDRYGHRESRVSEPGRGAQHCAQVGTVAARQMRRSADYVVWAASRIVTRGGNGGR